VYAPGLTRRLEKATRNRHSSLLGPFVSYKEKKFCEYGPRLEEKRKKEGRKNFFIDWTNI